MDVQPMSDAESARKAHEIYARAIRPVLETEDNIGKMVMIDVDSGRYELDDEETESPADYLRALNPNADLFGIRIGYRTAYALGGVLERTSN